MVAGLSRNTFLKQLWIAFTILSSVLSLTPEAKAKGGHPIYDRCGEYTVFGIITCTGEDTRLIQNPETDSELRIRLVSNQTACRFYRDRPIRLNIQLNSLDFNSKALILEKSLHRVKSAAMMVPPLLKKESPCK